MAATWDPLPDAKPLAFKNLSVPDTFSQALHSMPVEYPRPLSRDHYAEKFLVSEAPDYTRLEAEIAQHAKEQQQWHTQGTAAQLDEQREETRQARLHGASQAEMGALDAAQRRELADAEGIRRHTDEMNRGLESLRSQAYHDIDRDAARKRGDELRQKFWWTNASFFEKALKDLDRMSGPEKVAFLTELERFAGESVPEYYLQGNADERKLVRTVDEAANAAMTRLKAAGQWTPSNRTYAWAKRFEKREVPATALNKKRYAKVVERLLMFDPNAVKACSRRAAPAGASAAPPSAKAEAARWTAAPGPDSMRYSTLFAFNGGLWAFNGGVLQKIDEKGTVVKELGRYGALPLYIQHHLACASPAGLLLISGGLELTDENGGHRSLGGQWNHTEKFACSAHFVWSLEKDGTLFRTDLGSGQYAAVGGTAQYADAKAFAATDAAAYIFRQGRLIKTDASSAASDVPTPGENPRSLFTLGDELWFLGESGTLYRGADDGWIRVGAKGSLSKTTLIFGQGDRLWRQEGDGTVYAFYRN